jgi:hypothetical protein
MQRDRKTGKRFKVRDQAQPTVTRLPLILAHLGRLRQAIRHQSAADEGSNSLSGYCQQAAWNRCAAMIRRRQRPHPYPHADGFSKSPCILKVREKPHF